MGEVRQNLGNRGVACRQRTKTFGINQPLGAPRASFFQIQVQTQAQNLSFSSALAASASEETFQLVSSGTIGVGLGSVLRIPVPGTNGLAIELEARKWKGSTSSLFLQSADGKRVLRLDLGENIKTGQLDYHWNQKGTKALFGIENHSSAGPVGGPLYQAAKYYKYAGRLFLAAGLAADVYSIVEAKKRSRQITKVVSGWAGAWAGCRMVGAAGARVGLGAGTIEPGAGNAIGTVLGGAVGCVVGGVGGYNAASWAGAEVYDTVEELYYERLDEESPPR